MLHHISLHVDDFAKERTFYLAALKPLGFEPVVERADALGLGMNGKPELWIKGDGARGKVHFALSAFAKEQVDEFYKAGLEAGGTDNGAPGVRERPYVTNYAAFLLDPEGNNIEVVAD